MIGSVNSYGPGVMNNLRAHFESGQSASGKSSEQGQTAKTSEALRAMRRAATIMERQTAMQELQAAQLRVAQLRRGQQGLIDVYA